MDRSVVQPHRHCMVVHNYYPRGEPRVQRQAEALAQSGFEVDVICLRKQDEPKADVTKGIHIYRLPVRRDKKRGLLGRLLEYLAFFFLASIKITVLHLRHRYQVIQVHNLPDFLVFAALVPRLTGSSVILDLHDLMPEFFMSRFGGQENRLAMRLLYLQERISCRFAHHVITVTERWRETLVSRGVAPSKCSVVMNVPDERIFSRRTPQRTSNDSFHLIYHGNLTYQYGIDLAVCAVAQAKPQVPNLHFTIHGRGEFLEDLEGLVAELDLREVVTLSPNLLSMEQLADLLASADVGLVPYRRDPFTDGILPTKLMEYAALGLPVIAARTPAIESYFTKDMVAFFKAGDVDALVERIVYLSRDENHCAELTRNIQQFSERYNWTTQRTEYLTLVAALNGSVRSGP